METSTVLERLAKELAEAFEIGKRDAPNEFGSLTFYKLKDDAPVWVGEAVREAHNIGSDDIMPNDWVYEACANMADHMCDSHPSDWDDYSSQWADGDVDVYNADRAKWLASHLFWGGVVDEAVSELGHSDQGIYGDIGIGQYYALSSIASTMIAAVQSRAEEISDEPENDAE